MVSETVHGPRGRLRSWFDRGGWVQAWHLVYLATLVVATALAVSDGDQSVARRVGLGVLAAAAASWYLLIVRWRYWEAPPARFAVLMLVAAALWFPLVIGHPAYGLTIFAAYGAAACPWLRRSVPTVAVLTGLVLLANALDGSRVDAAQVAVVVGIGALVVLAHATQGAISAESERRRRLIAELEATRTELAASERRAGALAERERLARDIHDALAQGFTSIVMLLEAADAKLPPGNAEARAPLDQALQTARDSLAEARRIVWALGLDVPSEPAALVASLERLAERTTAGGGPEVEVVVTGEPVALAAGRELALLRAAQEAVGNARRHAHAPRISVTLSWLGEEVILDVADDGRGFHAGGDQPDANPGGGFGLTSLAQRAREAGGSLTVDSAPGRGTTVSLSLPLRDVDDAVGTGPRSAGADAT